MSITIDSNAPYTTELPVDRLGTAVYMSAKDDVLGTLFAVVYRANPSSPKLSVLLVGAHGTSGYTNMTLDQRSRYWGACRALAPAHANSPVRRALAIAVLRTWATMDRPLRRQLLLDYGQEMRHWDEAAAGALGSKFALLHGKYPANIGRHLLDSGLITPKHVPTTVVDVVYEDSDDTINDNNQLAYLLGDQLEQLFDPLSEYNPEPTEKLYQAPAQPGINDDTKTVRDICEELFALVSHVQEDLAHFLQTFIVPMRIQLLRGNSNLSIERLNTVFAPTIDELYRVNTLLHDALQQAMSFGSVEVMKACGTTIPYFYRACMRHEAAMRDFEPKLAEIETQLPLQYSKARMNSVLQNSLNLTKLRLILQRLYKSRSWPTEAKEAYDVSVSTIDNFARSEPQSYQRTFTPTGKLLVEITDGWPAELELGSMSRRVVTVFDAVDILEPNNHLRALHHIIIIFTDAVVILQPFEPIPTKSSSGYHLPSVGDVLLHAMLNEVPLVSSNVPPLRVVMWAPILDVTFASFGKRSLQVISQPEPWKCSQGGTDVYSRVYELVQPDSNSSKLIELLAKAKMTTKTQPFHLFRLHGEDMTTFYSTVQELHGYREEVNRTSVAIFLSTQISREMLSAYDLTAAVSLRCEGSHVVVNIISRVGYSSKERIPRENLRRHIIGEVSYLITLSLSSQNRSALNSILSWNRDFSHAMVKWAKLPEPKKTHNHQESHQRAAENLGLSSSKQRGNSTPNIMGKLPSSSRDQSQSSKEQYMKEQSLKAHSSRDLSSRDVSSNYSDHIVPLHLRKRQDTIPPRPDHDSEAGTIDNPPEELEYRKSSLWTENSDEDEAEQRDVDAWYYQLQQDNESSLSSGLSEPPSLAPDTIQIGGFLTHSASQLYNSCAGRAFPALSSSGEFSDAATEHSVETETNDEDFSYLAGLVDVGTDVSQSPSLDSKVYPDLRETSFVRLGSFILHGDKSKAEILSHLNSQRSFKPPIPEELETQDKSSEDQILQDQAHQDWTPQDKTLDSDLEDLSFSEEGLEDTLASDPGEPGAEATASSPVEENTDFDFFPDYPKDFVSDNEDNVSHRSVGQEDNAGTIDEEDETDKQASDQETVKADNRNEILSNFSPVKDDEDEDEDAMDNWLMWDRRKSIASLAPSRGSVILSPVEKRQSYKLVPSKSEASFRKMVMSSSLNSLQLASFVVQLEQKLHSVPSPVASELKSIIDLTSAMFKSTETGVELENLRRRQVASMAWILVDLGYPSLVKGLLDIEWIRRSRIHEHFDFLEKGDALVPEDLWKVI